MRTVLAFTLFTAAASRPFAHEGHGQAGWHWHSGDLLVALATAVVMGLWLWRRGRR
jgi:hypothetical protein